MNTYRLTFNTSTNFKLPIGILDIIEADAYRFGYTKGGRANINGFLNDLIPTLSEYQEDLHQKILKYHGNDREKARLAEQTIYNVYLRPFDFHDDGYVTVPFRINKKHLDRFVEIHDVKLQYYDLDFTNYIRNLLTEYATRTADQRECLYSFSLLQQIKSTIKAHKVCRFYHGKFVSIFTPVSVEITPYSRCCLIVGVDPETSRPAVVELHQVRKMVVDDKVYKVTQEDCEVLQLYLNSIYEQEEQDNVWTKNFYESEE